VSADKTIILIPVLDDWESLAAVIESIDRSIDPSRRVRVLVVDDGSLESQVALEAMPPLRRLDALDLLILERNLGHQRAIAVGLAHIVDAGMPCDSVVVMDGDGEDDPDDIERLLVDLEAADRPSIVFAERTRRSESLVFRLGYLIFRVLHRSLTGYGVKFGNFSAVSAAFLRRITLSPELWNHYAASIMASRLPIRQVATRRLERIAGESKMNVVSLVAHGMSAMAVFGDRIAVRLLATTGLLIGVAAVALVGLDVTGVVDFAARITDPSGVLILIGVLEVVILLLMFVFLVLRARSEMQVIPLRDHQLFVREVRRVR